MKNLRSIQEKIISTESLRSIVTSMKAHASANIVQFEHAAKASDTYREVLDMALYVALLKERKNWSLGEMEKGRTIHIVFGSDFGLAGRFNERIAEFARKRIPNDPEDVVIVIGRQLLTRLEADYSIKEVFSVPQGEDTISLMVLNLLSAIERIKEEASINKILLYYIRLTSGNYMQEEREVLFPINPLHFTKKNVDWATRSIPDYHMDQERLVSDIINQYYFLTIYRSICLSIISENTIRISSMDSAKKSIDERFVELKRLQRKERQEAITNELSYRRPSGRR